MVLVPTDPLKHHSDPPGFLLAVSPVSVSAVRAGAEDRAHDGQVVTAREE